MARNGRCICDNQDAVDLESGACIVEGQETVDR